MPKPVDLEKLRSIGITGRHKGKAKVTTLSDQGQVTGRQIEYGDGRVEAIVRPVTVKSKVSLRDDG